jgi:NADH dehydrogenase (ubiquinone) 1 alpha subcomplex subunit 12/NADH dehydrogenase [ubiquinone] 1 alpha subcomplex assembly factor 2
MWEIAKWAQSVQRHGSAFRALRKMLQMDDIKVGTLVGTDKYGNQYFENKKEIVLGIESMEL